MDSTYKWRIIYKYRTKLTNQYQTQFEIGLIQFQKVKSKLCEGHELKGLKKSQNNSTSMTLKTQAV